MILDQFKLDGKTALVTGCKRGLGYGMARGLAEAGAYIIGVSATLESSGSKIQAEVEHAGRTFKGFSCDFSDRTALYDFINEVKNQVKQVDILVNNAGTILRKPAAEHPDEYWDKVIEVNLNAQFILSREFGKDMVERGYGKIIFTASMLSFQGGITVPGYTASKSGVAGLTKALANEWAGKGVNVNAIAPGYMATDNTQALRENPERYKAITERIPAGHWGRPSDMAGAVVFLSSSASDYMHGAVLTVDGGWLAR